MNLYQWIIIGVCALHFIVNTIYGAIKLNKFNKGFEIPCDMMILQANQSASADAERQQEEKESAEEQRQERAQKVQALKELKSQKVKQLVFGNDLKKKSGKKINAEKFAPNVNAKKIIKDLKKSNNVDE